MPAPYLTMADLARIYGVSPSTARKWAAADHWRRKGTRPKRYSLTDAQRSFDRHHGGRVARHLAGKYGAVRDTRAMDITVSVNDLGEFDTISVDALPVTGRDGGGRKTPTVREMAAILAALPDQFQDLPVTRYVDEGISGISYQLHYPREDGDNWTPHVSMW